LSENSELTYVELLNTPLTEIVRHCSHQTRSLNSKYTKNVSRKRIIGVFISPGNVSGGCKCRTYPLLLRGANSAPQVS